MCPIFCIALSVFNATIGSERTHFLFYFSRLPSMINTYHNYSFRFVLPELLPKSSPRISHWSTTATASYQASEARVLTKNPRRRISNVFRFENGSNIANCCDVGIENRSRFFLRRRWRWRFVIVGCGTQKSNSSVDKTSQDCVHQYCSVTGDYNSIVFYIHIG